MRGATPNEADRSVTLPSPGPRTHTHNFPTRAVVTKTGAARSRAAVQAGQHNGALAKEGLSPSAARKVSTPKAQPAHRQASRSTPLQHHHIPPKTPEPPATPTGSRTQMADVPPK